MEIESPYIAWNQKPIHADRLIHKALQIVVERRIIIVFGVRADAG